MWPFRKRRFDPDAVEINEFLHDDDGERLRDAMLKRDWATARGILSTDDPEHFMEYVRVAAHTKGVQEWIDGPIRDEPGSTLPLLIRGARAIAWAWDARGEGAADTVPPDVWRVWFDRLAIAEESLAEVLHRDPADDFEHPFLPPGHPLRRHVLYRLAAEEWRRGVR